MSGTPTASHLQCLCGAISEPASLLESLTLPIETELCNCNICRRTIGSLGASFAQLNGPPSKKSLENCTKYSKAGGRVDDYHCKTCGTRVFDHAPATDSWNACSGIVEPHYIEAEDCGKGVKPESQNVIKIVSHDFVGDTGDGGLAAIMRKLGGREVVCYAEGRQGGEMTSADLNALWSQTVKLEDRKEALHASCHCGSIQFNILPPPPDVLERPHSVTRWLRANGMKYWGILCACRSCRLTFGTSFAYQTYVMPENLVIQDPKTGPLKSPFKYTSYDEHTGNLRDSAAELKRVFPGLKYYYHSADNRRSFCGTCGARVFFERESRPQSVNVAAGVLRAESGCLAREWVEWEKGRVWWEEEAVDRELVEGWIGGWKRLEGEG